MEQMVTALGGEVSLLFASCFHVLCPESALPGKRSESIPREHRRFLSAYGMICSGLRQSKDFRILVPCVADEACRPLTYRAGQYDASVDIGISCAERKLADCTPDMRSSGAIFIGTTDELLRFERRLGRREEVLYRTAHGSLGGYLTSRLKDVVPDPPSLVAAESDVAGIDGLDDGLDDDGMMFRDQVSIEPNGPPTVVGDSGSLILQSSTSTPFAVHRGSRAASGGAGRREQWAFSLLRR